MQNGYLDLLNSFRLNEFEYGSSPWPAPFRGLCHDLFQYIIHARLNNTVKFENNPRGLYFSKALLRGLFLEGLIYGGEYR